jgi:biotin carboxylase
MNDNSIKTVLVGYSSTVLKSLDGRVPDGSVLIYDEPQIIESRGVVEKAAQHSTVLDVRPLGIHREDIRTDDMLLRRPPNATAVVAATDYGVVWAGALAELWGLPGAGAEAARAFRDKALLRSVMQGLVAQPDWRVVRSLEELEAFVDEHPDGHVLKPSNLQGSVGVQIGRGREGMQEAWSRCTQAGEPKYRASTATASRILVETRLSGREVSVEVFVRDGQLRFFNVTGKVVQEGEHPVELGHQVPAEGITPSALYELREGMEAIVRATGFKTGALHAEWFILGDDISLVECAARMPGDGIHELIDAAYELDYVQSWIELMRGADPGFPIGSSGAAVAVLERLRLTSAQATEAERNLEAVQGIWGVSIAPGDGGPALSSNDRNVTFFARGRDAGRARQRAEKAFDVVRALSGAAS